MMMKIMLIFMTLKKNHCNFNVTRKTLLIFLYQKEVSEKLFLMHKKTVLV